MSVRRITLRLDPEKVRDSEVIGFIDNIDKKQFRTVNNAIITKLHESISRMADTPLGEADNSNVSGFVGVVKSVLEAEIPKFLLAIFGNMVGSYKTIAIPEAEEKAVKEAAPTDEDADLDFLGG